jgi:hypothetical protein
MLSVTEVAEVGLVVVLLLPVRSGVRPTTDKVAPIAIRRT